MKGGMVLMAYTNKYMRIENTLLADIMQITKERGFKNDSQTIEEALKLYRDYHYMQNKACFINDQIIQVIQASYRMAESNINQKTNRVLSELAIQNAIQNFIIASSLDVDNADMSNYRLRALDFLKQNNRVLRLDELSDE